VSRSVRFATIIALCLLIVGCSSGGYSPTPLPNDYGRWWDDPPRRPEPTRPLDVRPRPLPSATAGPNNNFEDPGVNPFVDPWWDSESTFGMDVDTAAYGVARRFIEDGQLPPYAAVRLEEFVNSFDYGYRPPVDDSFAVHVDGGPTPFTSSRSLLLRIGIQGRAVADFARQPVSLTFVIDTSGSMDLDNRIGLVRDALSILVDGLDAQDTVAIVEFGTRARIVLNPTSAAEPDAIIDAINRLRPAGSTNAQAGLELGYDLARLGHRPGATDRVVLASDGVANVGLTDADSILGRIDREVASGIDLVTVGVGLGNFNDALLEQLANRGNGFYTYINDWRDAEKVFSQQLTGTLQLIARDAKVQVEFRREAVAAYRLLGYENRAIADDDFRDPRVDAGEVGAGHSVTALYEIELADGGRDRFLGTVRLRWTDPAGGPERSLVQDLDLGWLATDWDRATPEFQLAATVAAFAEILRQSPWSRAYHLEDVAYEADRLVRWFGRRDDVLEFSRLASRAAGLGDW
jgi:Ca-activated chloride channel family protein